MAVWVRDKRFYRTFFSLTLTIALQNLVVFSVNLADNIMLGAYQETSMGGVALVNQIQFLLQMLVMGAGEGVIVLAAQYWGKGQTDPIRRIVSIGMAVGLGASLVLGMVVFCFPHGCLRLLTNDESLIAEGARYLRIICFTYPLFAMTNILLCSLRSVETVRIGFVVSLSTLCINVTLNAILIYGKLGAPEMGVRGAAAATLIARAVEFLIVLGYVKLRDQKLRLRIRDFFRLDRGLLRDYARHGLPVILSNTSWGIAMFLQTAILGHMGKTAVAANSIATTVFQIMTVVSYGAASAAAVVIGKTVGEGRMDTVRQYAKTLQVLFLLIGAATGTALFLCRDAVLSFYTISPASLQLARTFMTVLSVTAVGTSYQMAVMTGILRGGGSTRFALINDMIFIWGVVLPSAFLSAFVWHLSPVIVFVCLKCDQILKCGVAVIKVNRGNWIHTVTRGSAVVETGCLEE